MRVFAVAEPDRISRVRFTADGDTLTVSSQRERWLRNVSIHTGEVTVWEIECGHRPWRIEYSADGRWLAVWCADDVIRLFRPDGTGPTDLPFAVAELRDLCFSPLREAEHQWLAVAGKTFRLLNTNSWRTLEAGNDAVFRCPAFAPTGDAVFVQNASSICRYGLAPFKPTWQQRYHGEEAFGNATKMRVSSDGALLAVLQRTTVVVLDADTGDFLREFTPHWPADIAFVPGTRSLAVTGLDGLLLYDAETGELAREYDWGIGHVTTITFSHDGAMGAAGGTSGRVAVWDVDG